MARGTAIVRVIGDVSGLKSALGKAESQLSGFSKRVAKFSAGAGLALGGALVANLGAGLKGIVENEDALAKFDDAASRSVKTIGQQRGALIEFSQALQRNTKLTQEDALAIGTQIAANQSLAGIVAKNVATLPQLSAVIADLSVKLGTDGAGAANLLARAMAKPEAASRLLIKSGIDLSAAEDAKLKSYSKSNNVLAAQEFILRKVQEATNGAAAAAGDTLSGKVIRAKNSIGELQESLAVALLPAVQKVTSVALAFSQWAEQNPTLVRNVAIGVGVLATALIGLGAVMYAVALINPYTLAILAVVAVAASIVWLSTRFEWFKNGVARVMDILYDLWVGRWAAMARVVANVVGGIASGVGKIAGFFGLDGIQDAANSVSDIANNVESAAKAAQKFSLGDAFSTGIDKLKDFKLPKFDVPAQKQLAFSGGKSLGSSVLKGVSDGVGDGKNSLADAISKTVRAARDRLKSAKDLAKQIRQAFDYSLNAMTLTDTGRSATLAYDLDQQLKKLRQFRAALDALRKKGLRGSVLTKLVEGGPDSLGAAQEILNSGQGGIANINKTSAAIDAERKALAEGEVKRRLGLDVNKPIKVVFDVTGADQEMKALIKKIVRVDGGGNVAVAFGRR